jgi:hypothetical protein
MAALPHASDLVIPDLIIPDLVTSHYRLPGHQIGVDIVASLRGASA